MSMYMVSANYSAASWKAFVSNPVDREAELTHSAQSFGVTIHNLFFAFGEHDVILLAEAPDQETLLSFLMTVAGAGAVTGVKTTMLFTSAQARAAMQRAKDAPSAYAPPGASRNVRRAHSMPQYHRP